VCLGETNQFKTKPARKDEEGHVILGPRNFTTKKVKKGSLDAVMLAKPSYVTIENDYTKPIEIENLRPNVIDGHKKIHDIAFKPAKHVREKYYTASFEHMNDRVDVKKDFRDADGNVVISPKNYLTNPPKAGQTGKGCYFNKQV